MVTPMTNRVSISILFFLSAFFAGFSSQAQTYRNPGKAAADPCVLRKPGGEAVAFEGRYYLYFTGSAPNAHSFICRSTSDFSSWDDEGVVFDGKGSWARNTYWAPEAYEIGGKYYLFFSAQNSDLPWTREEHFNIGVAVADRPTGPFTLLTDRPIFEPGYPIIDANLFIDEDGICYLTYSRCCYQHAVESELAEWARKEGWYKEIEESWVYGVKLKPDFTGIAGEPVLLLRPPVRRDDKQAEWESRSVTAREINRRWTEGSTLFKYRDKYYLMYSANNFAGDHYAVGYAVSEKPLGPYVKAENNPVLEKNTPIGGIVRGTGHNNVFFSPDRSEMYCVYHGRTEGEERRLFIDRMEIDSRGVLRVFGPTTTPQPVPAWIRKSDSHRSPASAPELSNPVVGGAADPWVITHENRYLWCFTEKDRGLSLYTSDDMSKLGTKHLLWKAPETGPCSQQIWAPELHRVAGRWYVYFAASDGENKNHRAFVLRSKTSDPTGEYELIGPLYTGDDPERKGANRWAIDMTIFHHKNQLYAVWSGWQGEKDEQHLFIAAMSNPWTISSARVRLCENDDYLWERTEEKESSRGLHEGPQVLQRQGCTFLVYSCGASWLPTYKLGLLELVGDDPMDSTSWKKHPRPVFQSTETVFGVGHACFIVDNADAAHPGHWIVYHAKRNRHPNWLRDVFIQPFQFDAEGFPVFGAPLERGRGEPGNILNNVSQ